MSRARWLHDARALALLAQPEHPPPRLHAAHGALHREHRRELVVDPVEGHDLGGAVAQLNGLALERGRHARRRRLVDLVGAVQRQQRRLRERREGGWELCTLDELLVRDHVHVERAEREDGVDEEVAVVLVRRQRVVEERGAHQLGQRRQPPRHLQRAQLVAVQVEALQLGQARPLLALRQRRDAVVREVQLQQPRALHDRLLQRREQVATEERHLQRPRTVGKRVDAGQPLAAQLDDPRRRRLSGRGAVQERELVQATEVVADERHRPAQTAAHTVPCVETDAG